MSRDDYKIEEIQWVPTSLYGRVIGKNGSRKRELEEKSGVRIHIPKNGPIQLRGTKKQRKDAKHLIHEIVKEADVASCPDWSELTFVKPNDIGYIIGKRRTNINYIMEKHNVKLKDQSDKLYIRGGIEDDQNKAAVDELRKIVTERMNIPSSSDWSELTFVEPNYVGYLIGYRGRTINYIMNKYNVALEFVGGKFYILGDINKDTNKMAIEELKGMQESCRDVFICPTDQDDWEKIPEVIPIGFALGWGFSKLKKLEDDFQLEIKIINSDDGLKHLAVNRNGGEDAKKKFAEFVRCYAKRLRCQPIFNKTILMVGNPDAVVTVCHSNRSNVPNAFVGDATQNTDLSYEKMREFKNVLLQERDNHVAICGLAMHIGEIFSRVEPGNYMVKEIEVSSLQHEQMSIDRIDLHKIKKSSNQPNPIVRYDIKILTPEPEICIFLKLYLERTMDRGLRFQEAVFDEGDFSVPSVGHFHFGSLNYCHSKITIADPFTSKFNFVYTFFY